MRQKRQAIFYFRVAMASIALLLPLLSLMVLGSLWLWQHGYVLYWALAACSIALVTYAAERWIFRVDLPETTATSAENTGVESDPAWSIREASAWAAIVDLSNQVRPLEITSRDEIFDLGVRAIETVARSMHPGEDHALWKFTLPEAFALIERVSSQLSAFVSGSIPLGDRMTVGQFLRLYRWRSAINAAEQVYDLWRIVRLMNPAAAATQEIREQLTRRAYEWGREELAKRLAQAYVREIGRAAIDLYSGRMRLAKGGMLQTTASSATLRERASAVKDVEEPVRILVAGQPGSGTTSLIDALRNGMRAALDAVAETKDYSAYAVDLEDGTETLMINSPGVTAGKHGMDAVLEAADHSDLIIWVTSAIHPEREIVKQVLDQIRRQAASRVSRKPQPIICVLSHIDVLRPIEDWSPPYNMAGTATPKVASIKNVISAAAVDLNIAKNDIIPVSLRAGAAYNVDAVRQRLIELMPEANRVRLLRVIEGAKTQTTLRRVWSQVINAGRAIKGSAK